MYITEKKLEEIRRRYNYTLVVPEDVVCALGFVRELLEAEADALKEREPSAFKSIERLERAAYEVFEICQDIEGRNFREE